MSRVNPASRLTTKALIAWSTHIKWPQQRPFHSGPQPVPMAGSLDSLSVADFQHITKNLSQPVIFEGPLTNAASLPAMKSWFNGRGLNKHYFQDVHDTEVVYELMGPRPALDGSTKPSAFYSSPEFLQAMSETPEWTHGRQDLAPQFFSFSGPLSLFIAALDSNISPSCDAPVTKLYIAQNSLSSLPAVLQKDLPTPSLITNSGKGDVYGTSIWLGLEETYTPLHRGPNPNILFQMHGSKLLRLTTADIGEKLFHRVQATLGQQGSSRFRTQDMMQGPERDMLDHEVWREASGDFMEARLSPGSALFIPYGWWHSVRSSHQDGRLNASVNWWFRYRQFRQRL
ncbi:Lysine-specific demethylase 8 [Ceratocystis platani]|uniref:Lysine-specific demethylase 8 n=1 Tax=Ceratocystis fimbriata f. sp. platani TaxID=88771 RepID=A0A0F8D2P9_CERFI|nr:Lysine-specific demethylase 8 [Ceratocystis platani]